MAGFNENRMVDNAKLIQTAFESDRTKQTKTLVSFKTFSSYLISVTVVPKMEITYIVSVDVRIKAVGSPLPINPGTFSITVAPFPYSTIFISTPAHSERFSSE